VLPRWLSVVIDGRWRDGRESRGRAGDRVVEGRMGRRRRCGARRVQAAFARLLFKAIGLSGRLESARDARHPPVVGSEGVGKTKRRDETGGTRPASNDPHPLPTPRTPPSQTETPPCSRDPPDPLDPRGPPNPPDPPSRPSAKPIPDFPISPAALTFGDGGLGEGCAAPSLCARVGACGAARGRPAIGRAPARPPQPMGCPGSGQPSSRAGSPNWSIAAIVCRARFSVGSRDPDELHFLGPVDSRTTPNGTATRAPPPTKSSRLTPASLDFFSLSAQRSIARRRGQRGGRGRRNKVHRLRQALPGHRSVSFFTLSVRVYKPTPLSSAWDFNGFSRAVLSVIYIK
jgi:hypothetical protein